MNAERTDSRRPRLRRILWVLAAVCLLLLMVAAVTPGWLSTDSGRGWLFAVASDSIPGVLDAQGIDLNWTGGQTVRELKLKDARGNAVARVRQIETSYSLAQLARGSFKDGRIVIEGLELDLELDESGSLNLAAAVATPSKKEQPVDTRTMLRELIVQLPPSLELTVELRDARISLTGPGFVAPFECTAVNGTLKASGSGEPVRLDLQGTVDRTSHASLKIDLGGFDKTGRLQGSNASMRLTMDASWGDGKDAGEAVRMIRSLLGPTAKLNLEVVTAKDEVSLSSEAHSPVLDFSGGAVLSLGEGDRASLKVADAIKARYRITPGAVRALAAGNAEVVLDKELELTANVDSFGWTSDSKAVKATAKVALGDGKLNVRVGDSVETILWKDWVAIVATGGPDDGFKATLGGRLLDGIVTVQAAGQSAEQFRLNASVKDLPLDAIDRVAQGFTGRPGALVEWLGSKLNLTASYQPNDSNTAAASLVVNTERLNIDLPMTVDHEAQTIRGADVRVRYSLAPGVVPNLANESDLLLRLAATRFRLPLGAFDPKLAAVDAKLSVGKTTLAGATPVTLEGFECHIASESLAESVALDANGRIDTGTVEAHGKLDGLWDAEGRFGIDRARGLLDVVFSKFPIGRIEPAVGQRLDARIQVKATGTDAQVDVDCRSDLLTLVLPLRAANGRVDLRGPGSIRYRVTPEIARRFTNYELARPFGLDLSISSLSAPLAAKPDPEKTTAVAHLVLEPIVVSGFVQGRALTIANGDISFGGDNLSVGRLTAKGSLAVGGIDLGGPLAFDAHGSRTSAALILKSGRLTADLAAERADGVYRLTKPARATLRLHPALLDAFEVRSDWMGGDLAIVMDVSQLEIPTDLALERMNVNVGVAVDEAALRSEGREVTLKGAKLAVSSEAGDLSATASGGVGDGKFELSATVRQWMKAAGVNRDAAIEARLTSHDIPTGLVDLALPALVGEKIGIDARVAMPAGLQGQRGNVTFEAKAPRLTASADLRLDQGMALASPAGLVWTLTPEGARQLLPESKLRLREAMQFTATVRSFRRSAEGDLVLDATAVVPLATLIDERGKATTIRNLNLGLALPGADAPLKVTLDGAMEGGDKPGRLGGILTIDNAGQIRSLDELTVRGTISFSNVAVAPLDGLLALDGYLPAVLGEEASAALTLQLVRGLGPVDLRVTSGNLKADVAATIRKNAYVLREPIVADLVHSKLLADRVLPKLGPFFQGIVATEQPIAFRVDADGFLVPRPFDFDTVSIPSAVLDIGKVTLENKMLVQLVKQLARADTQDRTTAWFTPVQVRLAGGVVRYTKRLDLLFEKNIHFSTWGTADIGRDRVDMVIGVMPDTINRLLGIKRVGASDTLRIQLSGSLENPKFNLGSILRDVAAIRAKEEAVRRLPGIAGQIAEGALDALMRKSFAGAPPVPASVDPLPWVPVEKR